MDNNEDLAMFEEYLRTKETEDQLAAENPNVDHTPQPIEPKIDPTGKAFGKRRDLNSLSALLSTFQNGLSQVAGNKADHSASKHLQKLGQNEVDEAQYKLKQESAAKKAKMDEEKHNINMDSAQQDLNMKVHKLMTSKLDFQDRQATKDPGSEQSKAAQDLFIENAKRFGRDVDEAEVRTRSAHFLAMAWPELKSAVEFSAKEEYKNKQLDLQKNGQDLRRDQFEHSKDMDKANLDYKKHKLDSDNEMKKNKLDIKKEEAYRKKNDGASIYDLEDARDAVNDQIQSANELLSAAKKYQKDSFLGTGPFATLNGLSRYLDQDVQKLHAMYSGESLNTMVKMFAGMSKAIDSDGERKFFQESQGSISNDDKVNIDLIQRRIKMLEKLKAKTDKRYNREMQRINGEFSDKNTEIQETPENPGIDIFMKQNGISDRDEAIKILKKHGRL